MDRHPPRAQWKRLGEQGLFLKSPTRWFDKDDKSSCRLLISSHGNLVLQLSMLAAGGKS